MILYYDFGSGDFEFEPTGEELRYALRHILQDYSKEKLMEILDNPEYNDDCTKEELIEGIIDNDKEEEFENDLWGYFERDASSEYEGYCEYQRDMYGYYGLRESDFH